MTNKKNPSIYSDRGSIGSAEELDEYGVWVKGEPRVLSSDTSGDISMPDFDDTLEDMDFPEDDFNIVDSGQQDSALSAGGVPGADFDDFSITEGDSGAGSLALDDDFNVEDEDSLSAIDFSDGDFRDESGAWSGAESSAEGGAGNGVENDDIFDDTLLAEETLDASLDDFSITESVSDSLVLNDDDFNIEDADPLSAIDLSDDDFKVESGAESDIGNDDILEDLPAGDAEEALVLDDDFNIEDGGGLDDGDSLSAIDLSDDDFKVEIGDESGVESDVVNDDIPEDLPAGDAPDVGLDDFSVMESDSVIAAPAPEEDDFEVPTVSSIENARPAPAQDKEGDLSTQLLLKIANELASIRSELTELKKEFTQVRTTAPVEKVEKKEDAHGGFFSEEEDETIALTGDELDNILHTADFTEESGANEAPEDLGTEEDLPADDGIDIDTTEDLSADVPPVEDIADVTVELDESGDLQEDALIEIDVEDLGIDLDPETLLSEKAGEDSPEEEVEAAENISAESISAESISVEDISDSIEAEPVDILSDDAGLDDAEPVDILSDDLSSDEIDVGFADINISEDFSIDSSDDSDDSSEVEMTMADLPDEENDSAVLEELRNEGATPLTFAPEDSSYLEEEVIEDIPFDLDDSLDLSEAVIDEPELSAELIDEPVTEPSLEDMIDTDIDIGSFDDLTIENIDDEDEIENPVVMETLEAVEAGGVGEDDVLSFGSDQAMEQIVPEGFETEIEEVPVLFEDSKEDITVEDFDFVPENQEEDASASIADAEEISVKTGADVPSGLMNELRNVLGYMDKLLGSLPEEKFEEFARSEYFDSYKKLFKELGLV